MPDEGKYGQWSGAGKNCEYIKINGYWVTGYRFNSQREYYSIAACLNGGEALKARVKEHMEKTLPDVKKVLVRSLKITGVCIEMICDPAKSKKDSVMEYITGVTEYLGREGVPGAQCCPICGRELEGEPSERAKVNRTVLDAHTKCLEEYQEEKQAEFEEKMREYEEGEKNIGRGIIGALIGGVTGIIPFIWMYTVIGFKAGGIWALTVAAVYYGYKLLGGKQAKGRLSVIAAISVIMVPIGFFLGEVFTAYGAYGGYPLSQIPGLLAQLFNSDAAFRSGFLTRLGATAAFASIGLFGGIYVLHIFTKTQLESDKTAVVRL